MTVRPANEADLPSILDIYNDAVLHTTASFDYEPRTLEQRREWFAVHQRGGYPVFVAVDEAGAVWGWSSLGQYRERKGYQFTVENSVYVHPARRGQGIGKLLLQALIAAARQRGDRAILAGIEAENEASLRLHAAFGFVKVAHFRRIGFKFDRWLDVVYLELLLGEGAPGEAAGTRDRFATSTPPGQSAIEREFL